jgi:hypothetical protein
MYRIDNATSADALPTPEVAGVNPDGFFTKGNPDDGIPATVVTADWANAIQEELAKVIEDAGIALDKTSHAQLKLAIQSMQQGNASLYAASTTAANTYTATLAPAPSAYTIGMVVFIKFTNHNTGSATINLNGLGAKTIKTIDGVNLNSNYIKDGMIAALAYDGTNFQLLNQSNSTVISDIQNDAYNYTASTTAANTYTATLSPAPTSYTAGMRVPVKFTNANTGAATINLNSLGAKSIVKPDGTALSSSGEIAAGMIALLIYDGTNFQLLNPRLLRINSVVVQVFTGSGTYTPTSGMAYATFAMVGGGGAGGGAAGGASAAAAGGGGGGAEAAYGSFSAATAGAGLSITIGAGGTSGGAAPGNAGGNTLISGICECAGGSGGGTSTASSSVSSASGGNGGTGGSGSVFDARIAGQGGFPAWTSGTILGNGGAGGSVGCGLGLGGKGRIAGSGSGGIAGLAGAGYGSGSGGGTAFGVANGSGVAGQPGIVIITEYIRG